MMSKALLRYSQPLILAASLCCDIGSASAKVIFKADFETGDLSQWSATGIRGQNATPRNIQVVTDIVQEGKYAGKFTIHEDDVFNPQQLRVQVGGPKITVEEGSDTYMSFYLYMAEAPKDRDNFFYWEGQPPPRYDNVMTWWVEPKEGGGALIKYGTGNLGRNGTEWEADFAIGKWHQLAMHIHWSEDKDKGNTRLWLDGALVLDKKLKTKGPESVYFCQPGIHRSPHRPSVDTIYFDNFILADTLEDVLKEAPKQGKVAAANSTSITRAAAQPVRYSFDDAQAFLKRNCQACHQGTAPAGGFAIHQIDSPASIGTQTARWTQLAMRVRNGEMPPKGAPAPAIDQREQFTNWVTASVREVGCAAGAVPSPAHLRRLNRDEYAATIRDLLDIQVDISSSLPADGAGGEGFDNAGETLFLSTLLLEKYMKAAKFAMSAAAKEFKSREKILVARPGNGVSAEQAAGEILRAFLPRAFRRPVTPDDAAQYVTLFRAAGKQGLEFEPAILFTLQAVLVSPKFLFLAEPPNNSRDVRRVDAYSLASRMSYFLLGSMPDEFLFDIAAAGKLHDPAVVHELIPRLLRREQVLEFAKRFVDQWLRIRQLDTDKAPDAKLFPAWATDEELRSDIRLQPAIFFQEIFKRDLSVLNLIDSTQTVLTNKLVKHMAEPIKLTGDGQQPQWADLSKDSTRGGLLGMPAVLAVSSYPYRTSPVLRGAWILESILGTPPPPPPADVPALEKQASADVPKSVREMLTQHRANPACASCHSRIDPLGFALENYDFIGRWRDKDAGKPIDNRGELPDGAAIVGPQGLKAALLDRKDIFVRNLTAKMLGYALGRGLTVQDSCTVDRIVAELRENDYRAQKLIELIILSAPFQYQAPVAERPKGGKQ